MTRLSVFRFYKAESAFSKGQIFADIMARGQNTFERKTTLY